VKRSATSYRCAKLGMVARAEAEAKALLEHSLSWVHAREIRAEE
jgi:hypothetical protein